MASHLPGPLGFPIMKGDCGPNIAYRGLASTEEMDHGGVMRESDDRRIISCLNGVWSQLGVLTESFSNSIIYIQGY